MSDLDRNDIRKLLADIHEISKNMKGMNDRLKEISHILAQQRDQMGNHSGLSIETVPIIPIDTPILDLDGNDWK